MARTVRDLIRADIRREYLPPRPDLASRAFVLVHSEEDRRHVRSIGKPATPGRRLGRLAVETLASACILLVGAGALIGQRLRDSVVTLPAGIQLGGLRPPEADLSIVDYRFVSDQIGWILAQKAVHGGPTALFATRDGGVHWNEQLRFAAGTGGPGSMAFWPGGADGVVTRLAIDANHQTTGVQVFTTHDGGNHWTLSTQAAGGSLPFFLTTLQAWKTANPQPSGAASMVAVLQSTDGGAQWSQLGSVPGPTGELRFIDPQTGWYVPSNPPSPTLDQNTGGIIQRAASAPLYMTTDGGRTWLAQSVSLPTTIGTADQIRIVPPVMLDSSHGLLPVQLIPVANPATTAARGVTNFVLSSSDGGLHWVNAVRLPANLDQGGEVFLGSSDWLVANGTVLMETHDAGHSWTSRHVLVDGFNFDLVPWLLVNSSTIWSQAGPSSLIRSTDGGQHWSPVMPPHIT